MQLAKAQRELIDVAIGRISEVSALMGNKEDCNAYRLLDAGETEGLQIAINTYRAIFRNVTLSWGDNVHEVLDIVDDLADEWDRLFNVMGQRLKNHLPLELARAACRRVNERLKEIIKSSVGTKVKESSKKFLRDFIVALSDLRKAMMTELVTPKLQEGDNPTREKKPFCERLSRAQRRQHDWAAIRKIMKEKKCSDEDAAKFAQEDGLLLNYSTAHSAASAYRRALGNYTEEKWNKITLPETDE